jgi:amino acid adenylation domain-containing protein/non-ribosomal peptide synthase protein (TIGR01720 family)
MNVRLTKDCFPLSPLQQGMLFHWLKEPRSGVDIEQLVVHLPEEIDPAKLKSACEWLVSRHEILRARFDWENIERPQQEILDKISTPLLLIDARGDSEAEKQYRLERFLKEDRIQGFDLQTAPLLRFTLFRWARSSFSLVWTFHHALLDGRCFPILLRELFETYERPISEPLPDDPVESAFRQHIDWLQNQDHKQNGRFWRDYLDSFRAPTPLVVDHKPTEVEFPQGEAWEHLDAQTTSRIRQCAESNNLTMNSIVMGAWSILLHRYSSETDIVFGATRACRKSSGARAADAIGLYINTIPVRVKLSEETPVLTILQDLRSQWLALRAVENTPLAFVKAHSQVAASQPLFETLLVFEKYRLDDVMRSLGGTWSNRRVELHELTNFPITLAAYDGANLSFKIEFDRRRLTEEAVRRVLGHLRRLLEGIAAGPNRTVGDLELLNEGEERTLVVGFNRHEQPGGNPQPLDGRATLHELFEDQVRQQPRRAALTCDGISLTYAEMNQQANRLAHRLIHLGVGPDSLVGLSLERSANLVIAILAVLKAGGAYLPIDLAYPAERLRFIVDDAQAAVLVTETKLASSLPSTAAKVICVDEPAAQESSSRFDENPSMGARADNLAYVIYTSGTTGKPKGTLITHRNVVRLFASTEHWFHFNHTDVWTLFHSSAFDFSVWEIWGALLYGGRLVVVPFLTSRSPENFYQLLQREQVTVLNQTPSAFRQLIQVDESKAADGFALRYVIFGGEALEMESLRPWFARHGDKKPQLVNMYGITETTVHVTYRPLSQNDLDSGSVIGIPIPDLQLYILDSRKRPVPIGVPGEMYVGGAGLARGYLRRPDLTEQKFVPNHFSTGSASKLYRTGDLARFLPGKEIEYLGRIDDQVKIRGFRIELGEIESVLRQHPEIREVSVIAREITSGTKQLVAYIVASNARIELADLREFLKKKLPDYMVPAAFVFLPALPLTNNGKIDRKALPEPEPERPALRETFLAPRNETETKLAQIWAKVLRVEKVGVNDNFFELGGDSILSIQIIALARRQGIRLTPKQLFDNQTIQELCRVAAIEVDADVSQENLTGDFSLTPIQRWFFEQNLDDANYYNQAFLLDVSVPLNREVLAQAMRQVESQHDALRLRFTNKDGVSRQWYAVLAKYAPLDFVDLADATAEAQAQGIREASIAAQARLDLSEGPVWRIVSFDLGVNRPGKLLVVVHHLAVDGVSWRPLLEDLETAYTQIAEGREPKLPAKTASFKKWAAELVECAKSDVLEKELSYWACEEATAQSRVNAPFANVEPGTEADAHTLVQSLSNPRTLKLLQHVPAFYRSQTNDVLLAAFAQAWQRWSGNNVLDIALEGHGRESLLKELDLSRTVGWFTSIFPVRIEVPGSLDPKNFSGFVTHVAEQLRKIPHKGIGYGILRYLSGEKALFSAAEPNVVFNYLGQFDRALNDSHIFRFAKEDSGSWHSPRQRRRYAIEVNCVVVNDEMQIRWTFPGNLKPSLEILARDFFESLQRLIEHCDRRAAGHPTLADFPLVAIDGPTLDHLLVAEPNLEDVCPLSPIQSLYFLANPVRLSTSFDQWHCTLEGHLEVPLLQHAWRQTVNRHSILRSSIHGEGLSEALQVVVREVDPSWDLLDWSSRPATEVESSWTEYLNRDRLKPLDLSAAPAMRFALIRLPQNRWKFLWSLPALFLDGWSWPIVFREASVRYKALLENRPPQLDPAPPYRNYLCWLASRSRQESGDFWANLFADFANPTALPRNHVRAGRTGKSFQRIGVRLQNEAWDTLQDVSRRCHLTPSAVIQTAWALLLAQKTRSGDVVFGAAFSGRPTDLADAEWIVGPFVNTLPVRVRLEGGRSLREQLQVVHQLLLSMHEHQFCSLAEIQRFSKVPPGRRLFDSLVVFQNYQIDSEAKSFGGRVPIADFAGPIHTNYPLLLLAEPQIGLQLTLIYDTQLLAAASVEQLARDFAIVLESLPLTLDAPLTDLWSRLSAPLNLENSERLTVSDQNFVPPQSKSEAAIAAIWRELFGLERVSVEENFFDLGGHSLLLLQMHRALQERLYPDLSVVTLFENPTVRSLARYMEHAASPRSSASSNFKARAQQQRGALQQMRDRLKKTVT